MQSNDETPSVVSRIPSTMSLPSNATAIRADITDTFSCDGKIYGYYADVDNDCQIFHICLPVTYADGKENMFRWSFVCPDETIFSQVRTSVFVLPKNSNNLLGYPSQELFTCIRPADWTSDCSDSSKFVALNRQFGASATDSASDDDQQQADNEQHAIDTNSLRSDEIAAAEASSKIVAVVVQPEPTEERIVAAAVRPKESEIEVKVYVQPEPALTIEPAAAQDDASDELPVYDAETSETQSFGLFKVIDKSDLPINEVADEKPVPADYPETVEQSVAVADSEQPQVQVKSLIAEIEDSDEKVMNSDIQSVQANQIVVSDNVVTTEAAVEISGQESTDLWNHNTQSVYDGGLMIDDNVEVNAILEDSEPADGASTEAIAKER